MRDLRRGFGGGAWRVRAASEELGLRARASGGVILPGGLGWRDGGRFHDFGPKFRGGAQNSVLADLMGARRGDQRDEFFDEFEGLKDQDTYTEEVAEQRLWVALAKLGMHTRFIFPFFDAEPKIQFQGLGQLVGLGPPGPLGIQIHPQWGSWWAYRALVIADVEAEVEPPDRNYCRSYLDNYEIPVIGRPSRRYPLKVFLGSADS